MRALPIVFVIASLVSCASERDPVAPEPRAGFESVATSIVIEPRSFHPGETARIEVSVTNTGPRAATLCFTSGCTIAWRAQDADGAAVAPGGFVCTADAPCFDLEPGETRRQEFEWRGEGFDPSTGDFRPLPPGDYLLFGGLDAFNFHRPSAPVQVKLLD